MTVQFSEECCTGQADDILWIYAKVGSEHYVPIGRLIFAFYSKFP